MNPKVSDDWARGRNPLDSRMGAVFSARHLHRRVNAGSTTSGRAALDLRRSDGIRRPAGPDFSGSDLGVIRDHVGVFCE
jgi:hypothetical protein